MSDIVVSSSPTHLLDRNPVAVYLASLTSTDSRRTMKQALNEIASLASSDRCDALYFPWHELRYQHTAAIRSALLQKGYAPATINRFLAAMKGVLKECRRLGLMSASDRESASDIKPIKSQRLPKGRSLSKGEIEDLKKAIAADTTLAGVRDSAILAILRAGLRRAEVVGLDLKDFKADDEAIVVRGGKGRKDRLVFLPTLAAQMVSRWVEVRGDAPGPLLLPISKSDNLVNRKLSAQSIATIMELRRVQAGIEPFSPHDFRRTCISDLLDAGVDIVTVQGIAGHANPATTARYDRRGDAAKKRAASALEF